MEIKVTIFETDAECLDHIGLEAQNYLYRAANLLRIFPDGFTPVGDYGWTAQITDENERTIGDISVSG